MATDITDANGMALVALDAGKHYIWIYKAGVTASSPDSVTVASPGIKDTAVVTVFSPSSPAPGTLCGVYGYVKGINDEIVEGAVVMAQITRSGIRRASDSLIISPLIVADTTDATGKFELGLYPNDDLIPAGTKYYIIVVDENGYPIVPGKNVEVPDQSTWEFSW